MTAKKAYQVSSQSIKVCEGLGLTGRVFANQKHAFFVTEGPTELVKRFYQATEDDVLAAAVCLLSEREIVEREFKTYSVWLNIPGESYDNKSVFLLNSETLKKAFPETLSSRIRIMADAYLSSEILESSNA